MSASTLDRVLKTLRDKAEADPDFADALACLARDPAGDPFRRPSATGLATARGINRQRQEERRSAFRSRALTTADVVALIDSISDRKAVERRRRRGKLLGLRVGNQMLHPGWQFDRRRGETRAGLEQILSALRDHFDDALAADALMVARHPDVAGRSIADLLAEGQIDRAVALIQRAGDQS